jgi:2-alkyl-3-oxoalkanoate reductase
MRVLVAGATGAIGQQLIPALITAGHQVTATTRSPAKLAGLRQAGAEPAVVDGLDALAVGEAVARAEPEVIVHEMTAIPAAIGLRHFDRSFAATNELRTTGLDHLLTAAKAAGVRRLIAQSFAGWPCAPDRARDGRDRGRDGGRDGGSRGGGAGGRMLTEEDPFDPDPPREQRVSLAAIRYLEQAVTSAPLEGLVLRYGGLYGPGASEGFVEMIRRRRIPVIGSGAGVWSFLHVADAATATVAALGLGAPGIYNVTDDDPAAVAEWLPAVARAVGAKPPRHIPAWLGRLAAGEVGVSMMTEVCGSSNAKARRELNWQPFWASWRDGFARGLGHE